MKKFASVLLAVLVVFSMFSFVVSAAAPTLTASASKTADIKKDDVVTVTVKLSGTGLCALTFDLKYDSSAFEVVEASSAKMFEYETLNADKIPGTVRLVCADTYANEADGNLLTVKFKALKATDSTMSISVSEAAISDDEAADGYVEITEDVTATGVSFKGYVEPSTDEPSTDEPSTDEPSTDEPSEHTCDYSKVSVVKAATCKEAGIKQKSCKVCGDIVEEAIPATGKCEPGAWKVVKAATTTAEGEKVQECKYCGEVLQRAKIAKLSSDPITNPAIPNTDAQA